MDTSSLFRVDGMVAVVTGGATGGNPPTQDLAHAMKRTNFRPKASA